MMAEPISMRTDPLVSQADLRSLGGRTILVTGAAGMLGSAFCEVLHRLVPEGKVIPLDRGLCDVRDRRSVLKWATERPDFILHCAGMALADECERQPDEARAVHVDGTVNVAELARTCGATMFYPQSVFIFDGHEQPVTEATRPSPRMVYGQLKLEAEQRLLALNSDALVVRMAGFFGGEHRDKNFVGIFTRDLARLLEQGVYGLDVGDRVWQPTYTHDHAANTLLLLANQCRGIYHMGAKGEATFFDVASACIEELGLSSVFSIHLRPSAFPVSEAAVRPARMVTARFRLEAEGHDRQRSWRNALHDYLSRPYFDPLRRYAAEMPR